MCPQIAEVMVIFVLVFKILVHGQNIDAITTKEYATRETLIAQLDNTTGTHERHKRGEECPASPPGNKGSCILCPMDQPDNPLARNFKYEHTDEDGNTCVCDFCRESSYMNGSCVCTPSGGLVSCILPDKGYTYMPSGFPNNCSVPFYCTTDIDCPGNLVVEQQCELNKDSVCGCQDGYHQSGETACTQIPGCQENHQPEYDNQPDESHTSYRCVPCPDGYDQPYNNSLERCQKVLDQIAITTITKEATTTGEVYTANISTSTTMSTGQYSSTTTLCNSTDSPNDGTNTRLLSKGTLAAVIIIVVFVTFFFGLSFLPIRRKCNKMCAKEKGHIEQGSAVQFNRSNGGVSLQV